jgi:protein-tyrosine phosphatase
MIDIHSHLLPQIDDGSNSWEESTAMARQAVADGTTELAVTHHIISNKEFGREPEILEKFLEMKKRLVAEKIALKLHLGSEIFYQHEINLKPRIATLNNTGKYFLVEFPMEGIPRGADDKFFELIMDGKIPIIAHPERNVGFMKNPSRAFDFVQRGALMQMNAGSLTGKYGGNVKELAAALMNSRLIHFVGSDGHNTTRRSMHMGETYRIVQETWGEKTARQIFYDNPRKMLAGEDLHVPEPLPVERVKKGSLLNPVRFFKKLVSSD